MKIHDMDAFLAEYIELCKKHDMQLNVGVNVVGMIEAPIVEDGIEFLNENVEFISKSTIDLRRLGRG